MAIFKTLWSNYPDPSVIKEKCFNKQKTSENPFGNYCAISLSECFIRSGIYLDQASGNKCWSHTGHRHLLLAEDFANWLNTGSVPGFGSTEKISPKDFQKILAGRTGVIFFKDYWQRGSETVSNRSGDHIDLWNKNEITHSSMWWRSIIEFFNIVSDLNASKEVWFWEVK